MTYNHIKETTLHKLQVTKCIIRFCDNCQKYFDALPHAKKSTYALDFILNLLLKRSVFHDLSKFEKIEQETYEKVIPKVQSTQKEFGYRSKENIAAINLLGEALEHHYKNNSHHPEHFKNGVNGMNILDVIEMLCDWWAVAETKNADIYKFIEDNSKRFSISKELENLLIGTIDYTTGVEDTTLGNLFWLVNEQSWICTWAFGESTPYIAYVSDFDKQIADILVNFEKLP